MSAPSTEQNSAEREVVIKHAEGLHMRPAMQFVDCANGLRSEITVSKADQTVDGKSIMQLTMLAATAGTRLVIRARGRDAQEAVDALVTILEDGTKNSD